MNASGYKWWNFFGIGIKVYALLELLEELESCFGEKYKIKHGFKVHEYLGNQAYFSIKYVAITKQMSIHWIMFESFSKPCWSWYISQP